MTAGRLDVLDTQRGRYRGALRVVRMAAGVQGDRAEPDPRPLARLGRVEPCVEVSTANNEELWSFLRDKVMTFEGIRDVETLSILKVHKLRYTSPATG